MVFKLAETAQKRWRRLRGFQLLADVITGVKFKDGERVSEEQLTEHQDLVIHQI